MPADPSRALALLRHHGWNTTSFQLLEPDVEHWFHPELDAFVGYVAVGRAWVAAGAPVAATEALARVAADFDAHAARQGRRVSFFAAGERFVRVAGHRALLIGEQPTWDPARWTEVLAASSSLRAQVRRPAAKGVTVRRADADELAPGRPLRDDVDRIVQAWSRGRTMAPMGFLVDVAPFSLPEERIYAVAERDGHAVAFLAAVPIYARQAWLVEDLLRLPGTPNGTTEALIDLAMREAAARGARMVTLGLAPLSGEVPRGLAWVAEVARPLYDFAGVHAFKARLRPEAWEPVFLTVPPGRWVWVALVDALRAFARGSFVGFALRTVARGPPFVVWGLLGALVAWVPILACVEPARWFPAPWVQTAWVAFDVGLAGLLYASTRSERRGLAVAALGVVAVDAVLTLTEALLWNVPRMEGVGEAAGVVVAVLGPTLATFALSGMLRGRAERASGAREPG